MHIACRWGRGGGGSGIVAVACRFYGRLVGARTFAEYGSGGWIGVRLQSLPVLSVNASALGKVVERGHERCRTVCGAYRQIWC